MSELSELIHNASLTKTQKMIARYILDHSADACFMTSTEIAMKLNVSESSVIRFSRSLGISGQGSQHIQLDHSACAACG